MRGGELAEDRSEPGDPRRPLAERPGRGRVRRWAGAPPARPTSCSRHVRGSRRSRRPAPAARSGPPAPRGPGSDSGIASRTVSSVEDVERLERGQERLVARFARSPQPGPGGRIAIESVRGCRPASRSPVVVRTESLLGLVDGGRIEPELVVLGHEAARAGLLADSPLAEDDRLAAAAEGVADAGPLLERNAARSGRESHLIPTPPWELGPSSRSRRPGATSPRTRPGRARR